MLNAVAVCQQTPNVRYEPWFIANFCTAIFAAAEDTYSCAYFVFDP